MYIGSRRFSKLKIRGYRIETIEVEFPCKKWRQKYRILIAIDILNKTRKHRIV